MTPLEVAARAVLVAMDHDTSPFYCGIDDCELCLLREAVLGIAPIPMILVCRCGYQHVDEEEWATRPHRTHRCAGCGGEWRPANVPTVGVAVLP